MINYEKAYLELVSKNKAMEKTIENQDKDYKELIKEHKKRLDIIFKLVK